MAKQDVQERFWSKVDKNGPIHPLLGTRCWLWTASQDGYGYGHFYVDRQRRGVNAAKFAYETEVGPVPDGLVVDHRCHVRHCVNPEHLRLATRKQNAENKPGARPDSRTGERGVRYNPYQRKFVVVITHNGKKRQYGSYLTVADAAIAARLKRAELFTHADGR